MLKLKQTCVSFAEKKLNLYSVQSLTGPWRRLAHKWYYIHDIFATHIQPSLQRDIAANSSIAVKHRAWQAIKTKIWSKRHYSKDSFEQHSQGICLQKQASSDTNKIKKHRYFCKHQLHTKMQCLSHVLYSKLITTVHQNLNRFQQKIVPAYNVLCLIIHEETVSPQ